MATNVINNFTIFGIFYFFKGVKKILFYFLKIEKTFVNKKWRAHNVPPIITNNLNHTENSLRKSSLSDG